MKLFATSLSLALSLFVSVQALSGLDAGRHAGIRAAGKENRLLENSLPPREHMHRRESGRVDWKKRSHNSLNRLRMEKKHRKRVPQQGGMPALGLTVRMVGKTDNELDPNDGRLHKRSSVASEKLAPEDGRNHKRAAKRQKSNAWDGRNHKRRTTIPDDSRLRHRTLFEPKSKKMAKRHWGKGESSNGTSSYPKEGSTDGSNDWSRNAAVSGQGSTGEQSYGSDSTTTATADQATSTASDSSETTSVVDGSYSSESETTATSTSDYTQAKETPSTQNTGSSSSGSGYSGGNQDSSSGSGSSDTSSYSSGSSSSDTSSYSSGSGSTDTSSYSSGSNSGSNGVSSGYSDSSNSGSSSTTTSATADDDDEDCEDDEDEDDDDDDEEDCDDSDETESTTTTSSNTGSSAETSDTSSSGNTSSSSSGSSSSAASSGGISFSGPATYYLQNGNAGSCGNVAQDSDMVVAIKTLVYSAGAKCGDKVTLTNTATGTSADAIVADTCPTCEGDGIDLSEGLFKALSNNNLGAGVVQVKYVISSA